MDLTEAERLLRSHADDTVSGPVLYDTERAAIVLVLGELERLRALAGEDDGTARDALAGTSPPIRRDHPRACPTCGLWQRTELAAAACTDPAHDRERTAPDASSAERCGRCRGTDMAHLGTGYYECRVCGHGWDGPYSAAPMDIR